MSSGFVPAGSGETRPENTDDWSKAQQAIEDSRRQTTERGKQEGGKSLYEVLQQNKTAKQEAFEENLRLKNQFRTLDDDEVDFLDSVLESTRAKEQQVKRETAEQLDAYRKQREAAEKASSEANSVVENGRIDARSLVPEEMWATTSRKRRHVKEQNHERVPKLPKKLSTTADASQNKLSAEPQKSHKVTPAHHDVEPASSTDDRDSTRRADPKPQETKHPAASVASPQASPPTLGLGAYSSDDE